MNISRLIEVLTEVRAEHGDLELSVFDVSQHSNYQGVVYPDKIDYLSWYTEVHVENWGHPVSQKMCVIYPAWNDWGGGE